jgi:hypothetical protein
MKERKMKKTLIGNQKLRKEMNPREEKKGMEVEENLMAFVTVPLPRPKPPG